jgi:phage antirepressor YoqD-like protein
MDKIFVYGNQSITFKKADGSLMVNATEMARPFGKQPIEWLRYKQCEEYLDALSKLRNHSLDNLVKITKGGNNPGTWMHEDVALEFARWLSPKFAIWCNDKVKELLQHGFTASEQTIEHMLENPDVIIQMATKLKEEREARLQAEKERDLNNKKAAFTDRIIASEDKVDIGQAAKILELPYGRNTLFKKLKEMGIFFRNKNEPLQEYINRGYFQLKEKFITRNEHEGFTVIKVLVTQKGLAYLAKRLNVIVSSKKMMSIK